MKPRTISEIVNDMADLGVSPETIGEEIQNIQEHIRKTMAEVSQMSSEEMTLRQARLNKGMTVEDVAEETGYSVKRILWHEENPGDLWAKECLEFCKLYGVSIDQVSFRNEISNEKQFFSLEETARRLEVLSTMKAKVSSIIQSVISDTMYTNQHLLSDLLLLIDDICGEDNVLNQELTVEKENHLNLSLAGR